MDSETFVQLNDSELVSYADKYVNHLNSKNIAIPTKNNTRGRPKNKKRKSSSNSLKPFSELNFQTKNREILKLVVSPHQINKVLSNNYLLKESDIIVDGETVKDSIIDENIDIDNVRCYFNSKAFQKLKKIIASKKQKKQSTCSSCGKRILDKKEPSSRCSRCLIWSHDSCIKVLSNPMEHWYCNFCKRNLLS